MPNDKGDHGPIQAEVEADMADLATLLAKRLKPYGFCLLVFEFEKGGGPARMNYLSNARREDMLRGLKEFIANADADPRFIKPKSSLQ